MQQVSINIRRVYRGFHNSTFSKTQEVCCINLKIFMALTVQSMYITKIKLDHQYYQNELSADLRMSRLWF